MEDIYLSAFNKTICLPGQLVERLVGDSTEPIGNCSFWLAQFNDVFVDSTLFPTCLPSTFIFYCKSTDGVISWMKEIYGNGSVNYLNLCSMYIVKDVEKYEKLDVDNCLTLIGKDVEKLVTVPKSF